MDDDRQAIVDQLSGKTTIDGTEQDSIVAFNERVRGARDSDSILNKTEINLESTTNMGK